MVPRVQDELNLRYAYVAVVLVGPKVALSQLLARARTRSSGND